MRIARVGVGVCALFAGACSGGSTPAEPQQPPERNAMSSRVVSPAEGVTVVLPMDYPYIIPGGLVVPKDSGHIALEVHMVVANDLPWAELNVYLLTGGTTTEYCGQNTPDAPTWGLLEAGWTETVTVTGFRVYRLPCEVTGFRAMLHTRNNGLLTPPTAAETVVESVTMRSFTLTR